MNKKSLMNSKRNNIRTQHCPSYGKNFYEQTSFLNKETFVTLSYIHENVFPYVPKFL
ncbi:hypothetical protein C5S39_13500 [Candidatus Methanophagaceae archaeon]|nr:hypothetical protein C5S39_13500 [Methanophagales archaeon]